MPVAFVFTPTIETDEGGGHPQMTHSGVISEGILTQAKFVPASFSPAVIITFFVTRVDNFSGFRGIAHNFFVPDSFL